MRVFRPTPVRQPVTDEYGAPDGVARLALWAGLAVLLVGAVAMRWKASAYSSPDYQVYLVDWFQHLKKVGFRHGFHTAFASYNMPYLYLLWFGGKLGLPARATIKGISNGFDLVLAFGVYRLVSHFTGRRQGMVAAGLVLVLPSIWFNSAVWGQVDAMYTCFCLLAFDQLLRRHQKWAWFWWGVALAMKLQAIFFLPFLAVAFLLNRRRDWLAPLLALVFPVVSLVPAALCGMSLRDMTSAYVGQATSTPSLRNAPSFWLLTTGGGRSPMALYPVAVWLALTMLAAYAVVLVLRHHWDLDPRRMVAAAASIAMLMPYFLPNMRNRYFYVAEVLIIVWAFLRPDRWWVCLLFEISMFLTYPENLLIVHQVLTASFWALVNAVVLAMMVRDSLVTPDALPVGASGDSGATLAPAPETLVEAGGVSGAHEPGASPAAP